MELIVTSLSATVALMLRHLGVLLAKRLSALLRS